MPLPTLPFRNEILHTIINKNSTTSAEYQTLPIALPGELIIPNRKHNANCTATPGEDDDGSQSCPDQFAISIALQILINI